MSSSNDLKFISKDYATRDDPPATPREIKDDMVWPVVKSFFEENGLLRHQLESCNEIYLTNFQDIVLKHREFTAEFEGEKYTVEFGELVFERPVHKENSDEIRPVTPLECINRDITYKSDMFIDIEVTNPQGFRQRHRKVHCGSVPVMVKSELCNLYNIRNDKKRLAELREDLYDQGGYFIVKGMPKIIACQERSAFNTCYSFKNKKTVPKYVSYTEVRSCSLSGAHSTVVQVGIINGNITVVVPYIDMSQIPMGILFQALGSGDELDMSRYIVPDMTDVQLLALLIPSFEQSKACKGQTAALHYIGLRGKKFMSNKSKTSNLENSKPKTKEEIEKEKAKQEKETADAISYATHLLSMEFLPHLGTGTESFIKKRFYLGYMIYKFLLVHLDRRPVEDRDHFLNKRPATAGQLLSQQFFSSFRRMKNEIINGIERNLRNNAVVNVPTLVNPKIITTSLMSALSNNAWGSRGKVSGISQNYDRFNMLAGFSNARKIITPMNADGGKVMAPRSQHPSQAYIVCPAETPEGKKCIWSKTPISTPTGLIEIGKMKNGDRVITVNPETHISSVTKITDYFITKKRIYTLINTGGFTIDATRDHPFLTQRGWQEIKDVIPTEDRVYMKYVLQNDEVPISEKVILKNLRRIRNVVNNYISFQNELEELHLLPLIENSPVSLILARLTGYMFADAYIGNKGAPYAKFFFGTKADVKEFQKDVGQLGFVKKKSRKETSTQSIGGRVFNQTCHIISYTGAFPRLMMALGVPVGKKLTQPTVIPDWIKDGSLAIQREFISGFQGGDGGSPCYMKRKGKKNAYNFTFGDTSRHKDPKYVQSQVEFFEWMKDILCKLNIVTHEIKIKKSPDSNNPEILLPISNSMETFINYMENVGYRYADTKRKRGEAVYFYMRYKRFIWEKQIALKEEINYRHDKGESPIELTREFGLTSRQVHGMFEQKGKETFPPRTLLNIEDFLAKYYDGEGCWFEIDSITKGEIVEVADFTTISDNHSFIANGFVTHNCGLVKTMALTSLITIGSSPDALLEIMGVSPNKTGNMNIIPFDIVAQSSSQVLKLPKVFVNGDQIGVTRFPQEITNELRYLRRNADLNPETSIAYNRLYNQVTISTEHGRICRPLFVVEKGKILLKEYHIRQINKGKWDEPSVFVNLLSRGFVELIDKTEEEEAYIVSYPSQLDDLSQSERMQVTHCELNPSLMYGTGASIIPYCDHNQCIERNEPVLMFDGSSKPIGNIKIGDEVITFNPETQQQSVSKIVHTYSAPTEKKMYELTTFSGRKIKATYDHKFMTSEGWVPIEDINPDETLVGISLEPSPIPFTRQNRVWLDEDQFKKRCQKYSIRSGIIEKHIQELKELNLLPLRDTDDRLYILARLFGFCLTDGSVFVTNGVPRISIDFGKEYSASLFEQDLSRLGIPKVSVRYYEKVLHENTLKAWKVEHSRYISSLLIALGFRPGKKTTGKYPVLQPWIMDGNMLTKREFLSAFQGGDGCRIRWNRTKVGFGFVIAETSKQSCNKHRKSLENMMTQIVLLLREFNIEVGDAISKEYKKAEDRVTVSYKISNSQDNLIRYFDQIGYRYDVDKISSSGITVEYIKLLNSIREERQVLANKVKKMYSDGENPSEIAEVLGKDIKEVRNIYHSRYKTVGIPKLKDTQWSVESWVKQVQVKETTLFMPIKAKKCIKSTIIADITTESSNHSFIAGNGFCVHNSPRNTYEASMGKQAIGVPSTNFLFQRKGIIHVLNHAEHPIIYSKAAKYSGILALPSVQNTVTFVGQWYGFNQEDSIIMNQSSIDRGFMCSTVYMGFEGKIRPHLNEEFEVPLETECNNFKGNTAKLDRITGIIPEGTEVEDGDVLIGRTVKMDSLPTIHSKKKNNISVIYKHLLPGKVHAVERGVNGDGYEYYRVVIAQQREPILGDKFASCHGQKGTVGRKYRSEDLPFTEYGETPDIIINPLAFPSQLIRLEGKSNFSLVSREVYPESITLSSLVRRSS